MTRIADVSARSFVALGGGHGLYTSLTALRQVADSLTAVVTVGDDGGSSGRLRSEMDVVPPGDLRMALSALCEDTPWGRTWRDVLQTRLETTGPLQGHAVGNLLIAGLWQHTGDIVEGLDWVARLLHARGRVLPLALEPLEIVAEMRLQDEDRTVRGQVAVATAEGRVVSLRLEPAQPRVPAATLEAITEADHVVLGPGSWYTSVLPHFLVAPVAEALVAAAARTIVTLNIAHEDVETVGMDRIDDVRALRRAAPGFVPGAVVLDESHASDPGLVEELERWGTTVVVEQMCLRGAIDRHDPDRLAAAIELAARKVTPGALRSP
ncbi:uridine diphosphate-N-acetylglucosamine-binding protein YvcK [Demequina capsici]|uniref:Putative gluconeogenesis factor n=1 Tax=Demequina capsici TaxID=3075620 RepID=A0AA96FA96_9MICO|nr:uridine diphosphate-N-acetylglucosamine-binding protein YvcK [Demequina sp. PMTSA13]WNM26033.1 uridine diphosphate-N-acetylglucosamine-binding protein YvcK [Demequina sp. PMTSA13]